MITTVLLAALALTPRPATLNVATDCGAIPDDGLDDTLAIRACLAQQPRELVIPIGVFDVNQQPNENKAALTVSTSDTVIRGEGPGSVVRLMRDANGFSGVRIWYVYASTADVERVVFRDLTIDGGRGPLTCLETKHTPGKPPDGKGQQQHGIMLVGQGATVRDVVVEGVNFTGLSGDAVFVYQSVEDYRLVGQTVGGYCRAGVAMNAYTDCLLDDTQGMRRITIDRNTFMADATATQGARAVDVEPNATVCDVTISNNFLDDIEVGGVARLRVDGNTLGDVGAQEGGGIIVVSANDFSVTNNTVRSKDLLTGGIYILKSHLGAISDNVVVQTSPVSGIWVSNNGSPSTDIALTRNRVSYEGAGEAAAFAILTQGVVGRLDVVDNVFAGAWRSGVQVFGADDAHVARNVWDVSREGVKLRSGSGILEIGVATVEGNRGTAAYVLQAFGAIQGLRDCGNTSTGAVTLGGNTLLPCSPMGAAVIDLEARVTALENAGGM